MTASKEVTASNAFLASALEEVPRLLGCLNRNPSSPHYGSFDRAHWHYRTHVLSCGRLQEAVYTLVLLHLERFEGNTLHRDARLAAWIDAATAYTARLQHRDGSFDEWYPRERSFVATSFVTNALAETLLLARRHGVRLSTEGTALHVLRASARWLAGAREKTVANQSAGAVAALSGASEVLEDRALADAAAAHVRDLLARQSPEGWWAEYGGPDIGYLSLHIDYLSRHFARTGDDAVRASLVKALRFLVHFLHPDGSAGGEHMARNTEYLIPSGFARLASLGVEEARLPAAAAHRAIRNGRGVTPRSLDDRYTCYTLYNWIEAGLLWKDDDGAADSLRARELDAYFPEAGLRVRAEGDRYFVTNLRKGGAFRLFIGDRVAVDSGAELPAQRATAGALGGEREIRSDASSCETRFAFTPVKEPVLTPVRGGLFYIAQSVLGRVPALSRVLKTVLRRASIQYSGGAIEGSRRFEFGGGRVRVIDLVPATMEATDVRVGVQGAYILVPSSRYFAPDARLLAEPRVIEEGGRTWIERVYPWT